MKIKRVIALAMLIALLIALMAGCNKQDGNNNNPGETSKVTPIAPGTMVYVPEYQTLPTELTEMNNVVYSDGYFYFTSYVKIGERTVTEDEYYYGKPYASSSYAMDSGAAVRAVPMPAAEATPLPDGSDADEVQAEDAAEDTEAASEPDGEVVGIMPVPEPEPPGDGMYTYDVFGYRLFRMKEDGSGYEQLQNYVSPEKPAGAEEADGEYSLNWLKIDVSGNLWVVESGYFSLINEDGGYQDFGNNYVIRSLDGTGSELYRVDLSQMKGESDYFYIQYMEIDNAGNLYLTASDNALHVFGKTGERIMKFETEPDSWLDNLVRLNDGRVAVMLYAEGNRYVKPINIESKSLDEGVKAPNNAYNNFPGSGDYSFYYNDGLCLTGFNMETGESEKLVNWINSDIDGDRINSLVMMPDGRIICFMYNYDGMSGANFEMVLMKQVDASTLPQKTVLTYACYYLDYNMRSSILKFNKTNEKYRIEVTSYNEYSSADDWEAGITKFTTEIISGKIPDIIQTSQFPMHIYDAKGLLEDLYPFIDADPDISRDALMMNVLGVFENKAGKLTQIAPSFMVQSLIGDKRIIGAEPGWTLDDLNAVIASLPEDTLVFSPYTSRQSVMYMAFASSMSEFLNLDTGECNFDGEGFKKLLSFIKSFPNEAEIDYEAIRTSYAGEGYYYDESEMIANGKMLLSMDYIYNLNSSSYMGRVLKENLIYKGFPCESKNGNAFQFEGALAMTTRCKDKQGAWEFMRIVLGEGYQENIWNIPTNKVVFDKRVEEALKTEIVKDEAGNSYEVPASGYWYWGADGVPIIENAVTKESIAEIIALIDRTDRQYYYDNSVMEIINEEAEYFFAGQKTADEVSAIIQGRVMIYINEQR